MRVKNLLIGFIMMSLYSVSQAWEPTKPINAVIGFAPGSGNELVFRKVSKIVQENTGASFVVEIKPGADTVVSMNNFINQPADGYFIAIPSQMSTYVTNDIWEKDAKRFNYDSFTDVITIGKTPLVLVASPKSQVNTPVEFLKYLHSGKPINVAIGAGAHRAAYEFIAYNMHVTGDVQVVNFNGPQQAALSVVSYDGKSTGTEFSIMPISIARPLIDAGKLKPIALTGEHKLKQYKDVPLFIDLIPNLKIYAAFYISLPPNTNPEIVSWYRTEFKKALLSKEFQDWASDNLIVTDSREFTDAGIKQNRENLRKNFLPILQKIELVH